MSLVSEAHLAPRKRTVALVRYMPAGKRRSYAGWALFVGLVIFNELRGVYVVVEFLKAWNG